VYVCMCVVSIRAGIRPVPGRQREFSVNHGVHGRTIYRHLSSDACSDHVYGQPRQADHRCTLDLRRRLLRAMARTYHHQVRQTSPCGFLDPGTGLQGYERCSCCFWCCCYQICDPLRLFHFITDRRQTLHTHTQQHSPQSHRDGFFTYVLIKF